MNNPYSLIEELIAAIENRRTQDVVRRRFGLSDGRSQTLQEIGNEYNITRERVRQIEKNGLDHLLKPEARQKIKPLEKEIYDYFSQYGELRREDKAIDDLVCYCFPASKIQEMQKKAEMELALCRAALSLILTLGEDFTHYPESDDFHSLWATNQGAIKSAKHAIDSAVKYFNKNPRVLKNEDLYQAVKDKLPDVSDKAVLSYVDASKLINENPFGEFGLVEWPEISPRGVRDRAYLILKKAGKPFHFSEVTNLINEQLPQGRPAYVQTVHNELIKDPRFVLIGRGIYALSDWGYQPGTVVDVIRQILKDKGTLTKDDIVKDVMAKRLIKENTVLINLQNRKVFKKLEDGRFSLV